MNDKELRQLKTELQGHVDARARLEGKEIALLERLKSEFDVDSLADAKAMLKELDADLATLDEKFQKALDKLEKREESDEQSE